jgi:iron-regulated transporter 1
VWLQLLCLAPLVIIGFFFLNEHSEVFMVLVFVTICSSRFGLWSFDLVETQLMQEMVLAADAGRINGAQEAFMNIGYLLSFVLTMVFSDPTQFVYPAVVSVGAIAMCAMCFCTFVARRCRPWLKHCENCRGADTQSSQSIVLDTE